LTFKKLLLPYLVLAVFLTACSSSVDTSQFNAEQYYNYAKELYESEDYELAIMQFQNIILQFPGSQVNDDAQFYLGMTYHNREQYLLAAYEFSKLIRNIPASPFVPESQFMLAESYYKLSPPYQLDQSYTKKAIEEFQAFIDFFPSNVKVDEAEAKIQELNEKLAEKDFRSGLIYERMDYTKAAMKYYAQVTEVYHDTKFAPMALYNKIKLEIDKGMKSEAFSDIATFIGRYPDHTYAAELKQLESSLIGQ
jgi:outer membrane protein assembly factor BamD